MEAKEARQLRNEKIESDLNSVFIDIKKAAKDGEKKLIYGENEYSFDLRHLDHLRCLGYSVRYYKDPTNPHLKITW